MASLKSMRRRGLGTLLALLAAFVLLACAEGPETKRDPQKAAESAGEIMLALRLEPQSENGLRVYHICAKCHGNEGWGEVDGSYPQLAGQHRKVLIKQLADIRSGLRVNPEMCPSSSVEKIGGPQALSDVAAYIGTLEMTVDNGKGPGTDLARGGVMYKEKCARCHGESGEGNGDKYVPRIQSQHYRYLVRQFKAMRDGERTNAYEDMVEHLKGISDEDASAILDYISRVPPPKELQAPPGWTNPDFS